MKKILLFLIFIATSVAASAQDVIVKKDGSTVLCKIVQVSPSEVIYLKWSDLNGPQYIMDSSLVSNINYMDGRQDKLNEQTTNSYAPGIQQTGEAQYNDNSLLRLDRARNNMGGSWKKKAKTLTIIGCTVGGALVIGGAVLMGIGARWSLDDDGLPPFIAGAIIFAGGITTGTVCLIKANQLKKQADNFLATFQVLKKDFIFSDGSCLSAGIDIIRNEHLQNFTPGIGIQYNF